MKRESKLYTINDVKTVNIALSETCNMTCSYCPHSLPDVFYKHRKEIFPKDNYLKIVDYLPSLPNLEYVCLTDFNEFFLIPGLATFYLPALKERNLDYIIATNGSIIPRDLSYYKTHNPKYLIVGLQTITEKQFYGTSRLKNISFDKYIENAARLIKYFCDNCKNTVISIEVAHNVTQSLVYEICGISFNKEIPSLDDQMVNITAIIEKISKMTGIIFHKKAGNTSRMSDQLVLAHSSDDKVIFGAKSFSDNVGLYNKLPTANPPVCFMEGAVFHMNNQVSVCCLDYKKMTTFANIMETSMDNIYQQYVDIINIMRTKGSPFECCRHCRGYYTWREKIARTLKSIVVSQ